MPPLTAAALAMLARVTRLEIVGIDDSLEPWYEENSNLYLFTGPSFASTNARIGRKPTMYENPPFESIDIDTPDDWDFAVVAARHLQETR